MTAVIYKADPKEIYETMARSNKVLLLFALFLTIFGVLGKAIRWKFILKKLGYEISIKNASKYFCVGMYGSVITPAKVGDVIRSHTLKRKENVPYTQGVSSVIFDRLIDLLSVFFLMFFGIFLIYFTKERQIFKDVPLLSVVIFTLLMIFGLYLLFSEKVGGRILKIFANKMGKKFTFLDPTHQTNGTIVDEIYRSFNTIKSSKVFFISLIGYTVLVWLITLIQAYIILSAFHVSVGFEYVLVFVPLAIVVGLIPVTLSGLGTREATMIYLFSFVSVSAADSGSMSLLLYVFGSIVPAIFGAFYFLKKN